MASEAEKLARGAPSARSADAPAALSCRGGALEFETWQLKALVGLGIDVVAPRRISLASRGWRARRERVFSLRELATFTEDRLALAWAAREAIAKALRLEGGLWVLPLTEMEIALGDHGELNLRSGPAMMQVLSDHGAEDVQLRHGFVMEHVIVVASMTGPDGRWSQLRWSWELSQGRPSDEARHMVEGLGGLTERGEWSGGGLEAPCLTPAPTEPLDPWAGEEPRFSISHDGELVAAVVALPRARP